MTVHTAAVVGTGRSALLAAEALVDAGVTDVVMIGQADRLRFDESADLWVADDAQHMRLVVAAHGPFHAEVAPDIPGCNDFARPVSCFDPRGKHVALVGAGGRQFVPRLSGAARVTVFHAVRLPVDRRRFLRRSRPAVRTVTTEVERVTPTGVRTVDGAHHVADAVVYAGRHVASAALRADTVIGVKDRSLQAVWGGGAAAYAGLAVHGFPNFFLVDGPGAVGSVGDQMRCVAACFRHLMADDATRAEVRLSAQQLFDEQGRVQDVGSAFEFVRGDEEDEDVYDGAATLVVADVPHPVRVRLAGYMDPNDGKYHWRGMVFGAPALSPGPVRVDVDDRAAAARITEATPWGYAIAGVGTPPFALDGAQVLEPAQAR